jgi:hypothetical protein
MNTDDPALRALDSRRTVFFDVENSSRAQHIAVMLEYLGLPDAVSTRVLAIGNWRVVSVETAHLLSSAGAALIHSAPAIGVKDWSDLRIAVDAGRWLGQARAGDVLEIVSDDQAFDAVGDLAASQGVVFRRLSLRTLAARGEVTAPKTTSRRRRPPGRSHRRRAR